MPRFKKGDLVVRTVVDCGSHKIGTYHTVVEQADDERVQLVGHSGWYNPEYYALLPGEKHDLKEVKDNTYTFVAPCKTMVSYTEVYRNLDREHPFAIAKRDDGFVAVYIHETIWRKAPCMKKKYRKNLIEALDARTMDMAGFFPPEHGALQNIVDAVKAIKLGPLKKGSEGTTITVEILEI